MALLALPLYREHARLIMTDAPSTALALLTAWLYIKMRTGDPGQLGIFALAGAIGALSGAIRPVSMSILIPFFLASILSAEQILKKLVKFILLAVPPLLYIAANMAYNNRVFGSPFRNGYNFWCPVPFDYPSLCFSTGYIKLNLKTILLSPIPALVVSGIVFYLLNIRFTTDRRTQEQNTPMRYLAEFTIAASAPIIAVHLLYFYQAERFYLPVIALLAVMCASMAGKWMEKLPASVAASVQGLIAALIVISSIRATVQKPFSRILAEQLDSSTPTNAIIISSMDPVYLDFFVGRSAGRLVIPISRNVEYASKLVCRVKVLNPKPYPSSSYDHRCTGLLKGGAREAVPLTADEGLGFLLAEAKHGRPICLETCLGVASDAKVVDTLKANFDFIKRGNFIYQLVSKKTQ